MNIVGYLFVLINFLVVSASQGYTGHISSIEVERGEVQSLANIVRNLDDFELGGFKSDQFYRLGNVGKYLSKNLLNYMRYGNVDPRTMGFIITAYYSNSLPPLAKKDQTVAYLVQEKELDGEFKAGFIDYLRRLHRDKRQNKK